MAKKTSKPKKSATRVSAKRVSGKSAVKKSLNVGEVPKKIKIPSVELAVTGGQTINLAKNIGKKVVLYFYPKDMTPGCTIEGHEFTKLKKDFAALNTVVYGVSRDTLSLHEKFKAKECYTIELISDADEALCKAFDVIKEKNMYGRKVRGIVRSTFIIDEGGAVTKEWRQVKAEGHAAAVLQYLKN